MNEPSFAVVGHPNKGKSSIVSTLAEDDSVQISPIPGTTTKARTFPMTVDGEVLYTLIDTPGFQRARRALEWLQSQNSSASQRSQTIRDFINEHENGDLFHDEVEVLKPLVNGAGILYIVDGTQPYSTQYEAEMEILRYTGQPSMALVNMIGDQDHRTEWIAALEQYFKIVREFNPYTAHFTRKLEILKGFGQLRLEWRAPLERAARELTRERNQRQHRSAQTIAELLFDALTHRVQIKELSFESATDAKRRGLKKLTDDIRQLEIQARAAVEAIFSHHKLSVHAEALTILEEDLFSKRSHEIWGLTATQLIATGAISGAAIGSGIDLAVGGASLLAGTAIGALIGGSTGAFSHRKLADVRVLGVSMGQELLQVGPVSNLNFPYVLLARTLFHYNQIATRTHARRDDIDLSEAVTHVSAQNLTSTHRKQLERQFTTIRRSAETQRRTTLVEKLRKTIEHLLIEQAELSDSNELKSLS